MPAQPHQIIVMGLKHNIVLWFQSHTWFVSIATSSIIESRPNMYSVERNSQDKLEGTFPKKEMSLFLVSHSTEITLVWAQRGVKSGNLYFNPWDSVLPNYGTQEKKGSSIYQSKCPWVTYIDPFRKSDVIKWLAAIARIAGTHINYMALSESP